MLRFSTTLIIIAIAVIQPYRVFAQHSISFYEIGWAIFHPLTSVKVKRALPTALKIYAEVASARTLDTLNSGGKLDAFRHTFVMAYLARGIKTKKLIKFGKAHENGNRRQFKKNKLEEGERPDSMACVMDLQNNQVGCSLGYGNKKLSDEQLKNLILEAIRLGACFYLKRDTENYYLTCNQNRILLHDYIGKWHIPKCLIKTNE